MANKWVHDTACNMLMKNGQKVSANKTITLYGNVGIGMWGAIDYLCHQEGYVWTRA
jgi:hypothetical protein